MNKDIIVWYSIEHCLKLDKADYKADFGIDNLIIDSGLLNITEIMAYKCEICCKKTQAGRQHTHHTGVAGGQWKKRAPTTMRKFAPNLHWITLPVSGMLIRMRACTSCIKRVKFNNAKKAAEKAAPVAAV